MAATRTATVDERVAKTPLVRKLMARPELGAVAGTILVFVFFGIVAGTSGMFSALGILNFLTVSAQLGIIAVAASMLMIGGEFDLSIGSMIGAAGVILAIPAAQWGWPIWACILLAFAIACVVGYVNGTIVIRTGLPSFIVTLAGLYILRGLTIGFTRLITGRTQVSGLKALAAQDWLAPVFSGEVGHGLMVWLASVGIIATRADGSPSISGIPMSIIWWVVLTAVATYILLRTRVGNWIFACGGDPNAARNVGVPVSAVKIGLFMFTACAATLFACVQVLDAGSADTNRGLLKEFEAIIASVIGGCLLTGGYGSAIGASFGALIFGTVQMGIFYTGVNTDWFKVFLGVVMLIAVIFNNFIRRKVTEAR
jgi:simple sugar transport system permease protein